MISDILATTEHHQIRTLPDDASQLEVADCATGAVLDFFPFTLEGLSEAALYIASLEAEPSQSDSLNHLTLASLIFEREGGYREERDLILRSLADQLDRYRENWKI